jgi:hypothetical protein
MPGTAFRERRARNPTGDSFRVSEGKHRPRPEFLPASSSGHTKWKKHIPFPTARAGSEATLRSFLRDPTPRLSNSTSRAFPSPKTAERTRRSAYEPARHADDARTISEETFAEEENFEIKVPYFDHTHDKSRDKSRRSKVAHKERGSLRRAYSGDELPRIRDHIIPVKSHTQTAKSKGKLKTLNETKRQVFIPSFVSVGNLARIIGVSLGGPRFIRNVPNIHGHVNQVDSSGR